MKTNVAICIQARMGSTRLPGKMLLEIKGIPIISWVIRRMKRTIDADKVILATSTSPHDNALYTLAKEESVEVYRGPEDDVLKRFCDVIRIHGCKHIVRICADNPFVDPEETDRAIRRHLSTEADYTFNHVPDDNNRYPDGLGAEVFRSQALLELEQITDNPEDHEHINNYVLNNRGKYRIQTLTAPEEIAFPSLRLDVDNTDDLEYLRKVAACGLTCESAAKEVVSAALKIGKQ